MNEILNMKSYSMTEFESISGAFLCGAQFGSIQICQLILNRISSEMHSVIVNPAFILAAKNGHIGVCKYLLSKGANIETRGINGETPLLIAADNNHSKMCKFLLNKANANILTCDNFGNSILHIACNRGYKKIAKIIIDYYNKLNSLQSQQINTDNIDNYLPLSYLLNHNKLTPIQLAKSEKLIRIILINIINRNRPNTIIYNDDDDVNIKCRHNNNNNDNIKQKTKQQKPRIISPFKPLPIDQTSHIPTSHLFWRTIGCDKDKCIFQSFNIYPFDRLKDSERIVVLTRVAEAMSGYKTDIKCNILNESTLYIVFVMMKKHIKQD